MSIATILIVSKIGRVTEAERSYRAMIHRLPRGELNADQLSRTLLWTKLLMLTGVLRMALRIVFDARPYAVGGEASAPEPATLEIGSGEHER